MISLKRAAYIVVPLAGGGPSQKWARDAGTGVTCRAVPIGARKIEFLTTSEAGSVDEGNVFVLSFNTATDASSCQSYLKQIGVLVEKQVRWAGSMQADGEELTQATEPPPGHGAASPHPRLRS